ncbi:hypothetical protein MIND_00073200 [Mycena indigotica]|uniref:Tail specific protease domain-containing protein n=1 Tax=Mycena indigotica TaxID=2126181 RepID=A0A8H6TDA2_9AGAR|nr:uncharacterized protein MIND_00073200 [Mycena indigotica]KAF7315578.1 hypothetical protein MIND_00073200 [Mycena indigotica]
MLKHSTIVLFAGLVVTRALGIDPCVDIAGQKWVSPAQARLCLQSFPVDNDLKASTIQTLNRTLAFHTSVNYQIQAPPPFDTEVHEDIIKDLARISESPYPSEFALHLDLFYSFRRLMDGHCTVLNLCYDSVFISYLPTPLALLTTEDGFQHVHIAPEAFAIASAEFPDQIELWQNALPGDLKGQLATLSGAKVLQINGQDPWLTVDANAMTTGGYQSFGTRQNSFFSSYSRGASGWSYIMGNFAQQVHPLTDSVDLTIQRVNSSQVEHITLPYRSRFGSSAKNFTDSASFRANNCMSQKGTNGINLYDSVSVSENIDTIPTIAHFEQQPQLDREDRKRPINVLVDAAPLWDIDLPEELHPTPPALNQSYSVAQFYMLNNTGVLALGSFSAANFTAFMGSLLDGLAELKALGATRLIIDVTNNGGGYICIAHWLHRIIVGPRATTEPNAGLLTTIRAGTLAQHVVENINAGGDPDALLLYNPTNWHNSSNLPFSTDYNWLKPTVNPTINGHADAFSPQLGAECQPFEMTPPDHALFEPEDVVIISNGRCASSCSLFSITMSKHEGVKTAVVGGKKETRQQYCGVVGGQSTHFVEMDTEIKSTGLKKVELAPPDFQTNSVLGITWRLAFGIDDPEKPEEWQDHPATFNIPVTMDTVNKPSELWKYTANVIFGDEIALPGDSQAYFSLH